MPTIERRLIILRGTFKACFCAVILASLMLGAESIQWDWRHSEALTFKQSLRHAKVTGTERAAIARAIANQLKPELGGLGGECEQELEDNALDTPVKLVDLNGDGTPEVVAQGTPEDGGCSPTGNCRFWIFQKSDYEYKLLFYQEAIQSFTIQRSRTNGFSDIVISTHGSADQSGIRLLRYSEGRYDYAGCWGAYWYVMEGDTRHELKEPRLIPCEGKQQVFLYPSNADLKVSATLKLPPVRNPQLLRRR
jgi:hypothetical protein